MAGRLPQAWLDELRDRADIVQVVSRYVQLNPKGGRYWGLCPFHGEKTPSFSVNPQRRCIIALVVMREEAPSHS